MIKKGIYGIKWYSRKVEKKIFGRTTDIKKYNGKTILRPEEGNDKIYSFISHALEKKEGVFIGRFGSNELDVMVKFEHYNGGKMNAYQRNALDRLCLNAGFFPKDSQLVGRYVDEMKDASNVLDLVGVWFNPFEDYILKKYAPRAEYCQLAGLEPYFYSHPWSRILQGKRVLVVHPFADSILQQYMTAREDLFQNQNVLPLFNLEIIKAVQTIAGQKDSRFGTWFDALDYMENLALAKDFDVAIIGCGAYGFPLAARLKRAGKIAVHLGGATQMLFGVKGARWEKIPSFNSIINDKWIYPIDSERPKDASKIENACYW